MSQIEIACYALLDLLEKHAAIRTIAGQLNMNGKKTAWRDAIVSLAEEHPFADAMERNLSPDCTLLARSAWVRWREEIADPDTRLVRLRNLVGQVQTLRSTIAAINTFGQRMEDKAL